MRPCARPMPASAGGSSNRPTTPALRVPAAQLRAARDRLPGPLRDGLEVMAANIERFHRVEVPPAEQWVNVAPGIEVGRVWRGLDRVAAYVPGGTAAYPSSLLMSAIPARLAGVGRYVVASPASADGQLSPALLGAAGLMEVDEFWVMGGAQAVGALAYGTESIGPVDRIVGPGNAWVTAAKLEVLDRLAIDMPAGPTEVMVLADDPPTRSTSPPTCSARPSTGPTPLPCWCTTSDALADAVEAEVARQLPTLLRRETLAEALAAAGIVVTRRTSPRPSTSSTSTHRSTSPSWWLTSMQPWHPAARRLPVPRAIRPRIGRRLRDRLQPRPAHGRRRARLQPARRGVLRAVDAGATGSTRAGLASITQAVAVVAEAEGLTAHRRAVEIRFEDERDDPAGHGSHRRGYQRLHLGATRPGHRGALRPGPPRTSCASTPTPRPRRRTSLADALAGPSTRASTSTPTRRTRTWPRRPPPTSARTRPRSSWALAPTRSWTSSPRPSWPPAGPLVPIPTYGMYGGAHLAARRAAAARAAPGQPMASPSTCDAVLARLPEAGVVWLCAPNNPTGAPSREGHRDPPGRRRAPAGRRTGHRGRRGLHRVHPGSLVAWRERYPHLDRRAHALQGLRPAGHARRVRRRRPPDDRAPRARPPAG